MMKTLKGQLDVIIFAEMQASKTRRILSTQALGNFTKLSRSKTEDLVQSAITEYNQAKTNNTKISRWSIPKKKHEIIDQKAEQFDNERIKPIKNVKFIIPDAKTKSLIRAADYAKKLVIAELKKYLNKYKPFKINVEFVLSMFKPTNKKEVKDVKIQMFGGWRIENMENIETVESDFMKKIDDKYDALEMIGSGLSLDRVIYCKLTFYKGKKLRGSSYIETPKAISNSKCGLVNIRNTDNECFKWCLKYHQSEKSKHSMRTTALSKIDDKYDYENINFPTCMEDIQTFERNNVETSINVFSYNNENNDVNVIRRSKNKGTDRINLLLISDSTNLDNEHYVYIKNMSQLFQASTKHNHIFCENCFRKYTDLQFKNHKCDVNESDDFKTTIEYLPVGQTMKTTIEQQKKQLMAPFIVYADFESTLQKTSDQNKFQKHVANSYAAKVVCSFDDALSYPLHLFRGENPTKNLIEWLLTIKDDTNRTMNKLRTKYKTPNLTEDEETSFLLETKCYLCKKQYTSESLPVRDHCHLTGKYRGSACNNCNLNYTNIKNGRNPDLVIVFHNLRSYDGHFIIKEAAQYTDNIRVIAQSFEKYMTINFAGLKFIDSFLFLSSSIEKLTENLIIKTGSSENGSSYKNFKYMAEYFKDNTNLLCQKGVYPYEYIDNNNKFLETTLPSQNHFFSTLSGKGITDEQYTQAKTVFNTMGCKTLGDYHDIYLKTDVLLLADIFENFRSSCSQKYNLDPANFVSTPALSWDAMLNITNQEIGLIHDEETRLFFEPSKRGGIVQAGGQRHAVANNKYMKNYDASTESSFISYLDMNNQYGFAMCDFLPHNLNGFVEKTLDEILQTADDNPTGYFVECDIHLPIQLHDKMKDYPACPESMAIKTEWLSDYQKSVLALNNVKHSNKSNKLVLNLFDKTKYVCHYRYLKCIVKLGYQITAIHRVIEFEQSQWLKTYIDKNSQYRKLAKSDFEKDLFKLLNNAIYGKTNEDVMKHSKFEIIKSDKIAIKRMSAEGFKSGVMLDEMFFIESKANTCKFNRPVYIGSAILDLSKVYMLNFHYDYMQIKYPDSKLIYTDTDSFVYHVKTNDLFQDQYDDKHLFDLSEVEIIKFNEQTNKKVVGKMKDETQMVPITEFIALGPKCYSLITDADYVIKKAKGVSRSVLANNITLQDYRATLKTGKSLDKENITIRSFKHQLYTYKFSKTCLSSFDDKVYRDTVNTGHPYGYIISSKIYND